MPKSNVPNDIKLPAKGQCCFLKYIPRNTNRKDKTGQEYNFVESKQVIMKPKSPKPSKKVKKSLYPMNNIYKYMPIHKNKKEPGRINFSLRLLIIE
jgi:hypothetical protein